MNQPQILCVCPQAHAYGVPKIVDFVAGLNPGLVPVVMKQTLCLSFRDRE
jgi:predicted metallopeptidase